MQKIRKIVRANSEKKIKNLIFEQFLQFSDILAISRGRRGFFQKKISLQHVRGPFVRSFYPKKVRN